MMLPKTYVYDTIERNRRLVPFPDQAQFVIGDAIEQYGEPGNAFVDAGSVLNIELPWGITARVDGLSREEAEYWGGELKLQIMRRREGMAR